VAPDFQIVYRVVDISRLEVWRLPHEPASGDDLIDDESRLIGSQFESLLVDELAHNGIE
jgi:hypothetical protein